MSMWKGYTELKNKMGVQGMDFRFFLELNQTEDEKIRGKLYKINGNNK